MASACAAPPSHRERARWLLSCAHAQADRERPKAGALHHCLAPNERALSLARRPFRARGRTPTRTARCARAASARAAPPPHRERARWLLYCAHAQADREEPKVGAWYHCLAPNERALSLARRPSRVREPIPTRAARCARAASARAALFPHRERARSLLSCAHAHADREEPKAGAWHHCLVPNERALSLARRPSRVRGRIPTRTARCAHATSACAAPSPHRERARWLARVCAHAQVAGRARGQCRRVSPGPCTKQNRLLAGAVPFHKAWPDYNQRGAAHARCKRACCASSRERASAVARSRVHTRASRMPVGGRDWHVGARPCTEGERPLAGAVLFQKDGVTTTSAARRAHTASARAAPPPERERAQWRDRVWAHAQAGCSLKVAADTSEHGLAPKERGSLLVQWSFLGYGPTTTSAARRARAASVRAAPPPERERAQWRDRVWAHA